MPRTDQRRLRLQAPVVRQTSKQELKMRGHTNEPQKGGKRSHAGAANKPQLGNEGQLKRD